MRDNHMLSLTKLGASGL